MNEKKYHITDRSVMLFLSAIFAVSLTLGAYAVDPVPSYKTLIMPTLLPKIGNTSVPPFASDDIRDAYETIYEPYWKDTSYFRYDEGTGATISGYYNDTKTFGYVNLPWAINPAAASMPIGPEPFNPASDDNPYLGEGEDFTDGDRLYSDHDNFVYVADGADADEYWTPGESFYDTDGDGQYTPYSSNNIPGEVWWDTDNTNALPQNWPGPFQVVNYHGTMDEYDERGELFADYDGGTIVDATGQVTWVDFDASTVIYVIEGQSNVVVTLTELDLTPRNNIANGGSSEEGDFFHAYHNDLGQREAGPNDILRNSRFDYQMDPSTGLPFVVQPVNRNNPAERLHLVYDRWMLNDSPYLGSQAAVDGATKETVLVPVYQSVELWGSNLTPEGGQDRHSDNNGVYEPGAIVVIEAEPFEDFISWNNHWVPEYGGIPLPPAPSTNPRDRQNDPGNPDGGPITAAEYDAYLRWNYPGDKDAIIARAGNGQYDGPEKWEEKRNNKFRIGTKDIVPDRSTFDPNSDMDGNGSPDHWHTDFFANWELWWNETFSTTDPAGNAPLWRLAIPNPVSMDPAEGWVAAGAVTTNALGVITTNLTGNVGGWIPISTWSYDSDREFCDLPSSLYHVGGGDWLGVFSAESMSTTIIPVGTPWMGPGIIGGDLALGEVTSPFNDSIYGQDLWMPSWTGANPSPEDKLISPASPWAFNINGTAGSDAGNVLNLEVLTWRTDGVYGINEHSVEHRDTNLDGLLDIGFPRTGEAYYNNDKNGLPGGDGSGPYPFNRQRYMEDTIEAWDQAQDFKDFRNSITGGRLPLYGYPIYMTTTNEASGGLGGPAGAHATVQTRDDNQPFDMYFQVRPMDGSGEVEGHATTNNVPSVGGGYAMGILCHEQGHDIQGWPDLYDYDKWRPGEDSVNAPIAAYDLMAGGGLVHGVPDMKADAGWITPINLESLVPANGESTVVEMKPVQLYPDQYYRYRNPENPGEYFYFWYTRNNRSFGVVGGDGVYISHSDNYAWPDGLPRQQRINNHFVWEIVQADGLNQLQDGVNNGDSGDPFPGSTGQYTFSADTDPAARWWDQKDSGIRIVDIIEPTTVEGAAKVVFQRFSPSDQFQYTLAGVDTDGDGMTDVWEYHYFGNLTTANADSDYDNDGLSDLGEFLSRTDPNNPETSTDATDDADGDGISNREEVDIYGSAPTLIDTDDDGLGDLAEAESGSDPADSLNPLLDRALDLDGLPGSYVEIPAAEGLALRTWTVEAWVKPDVLSASSIVERQQVPGEYNYRLGLNAVGNPEVRFSPADGAPDTVLTSLNPIAVGDWTHLSASFDYDSNHLWIEVNGQVAAETYTAKRAESTDTGNDEITVGTGFDGLIDEVRIWSQYPGQRSLAELKLVINSYAEGLESYLRFDDSTNPIGTSGNNAWDWGQVEDFADYGLLYTTNVTGGVTNITAETTNVVAGVTNIVAATTNVTAFVTNVTSSIYMEGSLGWNAKWLEDASLFGNAAMVFAGSDAPVQGSQEDSNGDGINDSWYVDQGLGPNGDSVAGEDWDNDGLVNLYEFRGDQDPNKYDTSGNGLSDFDTLAPGTGLTYGELLDDGDGVPYNFELESPGYLDPKRFDAFDDPDMDGWDNLSEFLAGTDPSDKSDMPRPNVYVRVDGAVAASNTVSWIAWDQTEMDGDSTATGTVQPAVGESVLTVDSGALTQGDNYILFFDANGAWGEDKLAGFPDQMPVVVGYGDVHGVRVGLTVDPLGYKRFSWDDATTHKIGLRLNTAVGRPFIFERDIVGRNFVHEYDFKDLGNASRYAAMPYEFLQSNSGKPEYEWYLDDVSQGTFTLDWSDALGVPSPVWPSGIVAFAGKPFVWTHSGGNASRFVIEIRQTSAAGPVVYSETIAAPVPTDDGSYEFQVPIPFGNGALEDGTYVWRVTAWNPWVAQQTSAWKSFSVDTTSKQSGPYEIRGDLWYMGRGDVSAADFIVQAFTSTGMGSHPVQQAEISGAGAWRLPGLQAGTYYVRAFMDVDGDREYSKTEPYAFLKSPDPYAVYYTVKAIEVGPNSEGNRIIVRDVDTDNDEFSDVWEWQTFGDLATVDADYLGAYAKHSTELLTAIVDMLPLSMTHSTAGDGVPDVLKLVLGYDVMDTIPAANLLQISAVNLALGRVTFDLSSGLPPLQRAVRVYVQYSKDLITWQDLPGYSKDVGPGSGEWFVYPGKSDDAVIYYRLRWEPLR